jgi:hypothetical protein
MCSRERWYRMEQSDVVRVMVFDWASGQADDMHARLCFAISRAGGRLLETSAETFHKLKHDNEVH